MGKAKILYFKTKNLVCFKTRKVADGKIVYDKKRDYNINKVRPIMIEVPNFGGLLGTKIMPMYAISWKNSNPVNLDSEEDLGSDKKTRRFLNISLSDDKRKKKEKLIDKRRETIEGKQDEKPLDYYSPESQSSISKSATLKTLLTLKSKTSTGDMFMWIIMGVCIGYIVGNMIPFTALQVI